MKQNNEKINLLRDFIGISHWQSLVAILIFGLLILVFYKLIKRYQIKFPHRVLIGIVFGLCFGIVMQAITNFSPDQISSPTIPDPNQPGKQINNPNYLEWLGQVSTWVSLLKYIFITGIVMLTIPIVFLAITRICAQKNNQKQNLLNLSLSGIIILLINVAVAFIIAFILGIVFKIGSQSNLASSGSYDKAASKNLVDIIIGYLPVSFIGVFTQFLIIPIIVLGALVGFAIKKSTKHYEQAMNQARTALDTMWRIVISVLMFFVKIMPYAVFSMLASTIINQPIGDLVQIGIIIGVAYLALALTFCWHLLTLFLFGIKPLRWVKKVQAPIVSGFTTQSSNVALPIAIESLKNNVGISEVATNTIMPLSTTIGLSGCAGVQSGIILAFLYYSVINHELFPQWTIPILFINGLFVTIITSLGIAGVPGTASVVTAGVLGSLGFMGYYYPVYGIIGALDGLLDMGRTALNISGGLQATTITAKNRQLINDYSIQTPNYPLRFLRQFFDWYQIKQTIKKQRQTDINQQKTEFKHNLNQTLTMFEKQQKRTALKLKLTEIKQAYQAKVQKINELKKQQEQMQKQITNEYHKQRKIIKDQNKHKSLKLTTLKQSYLTKYYEHEQKSTKELNFTIEQKSKDV